MNDRSFREEALKFALDGDSIQNLLRVAVSDWGMDRRRAIETIAELARQGLVAACENDSQTGRNILVDATELTLARLDSTPYTYLLKSDRTAPALEALSADQPNLKSA